ncbi:unnamed protein product [Prorocentrum cordatum]|uniref:Secreted protein n=1 Tax=Prorocentrum cordatum TaxID=2364126 RepID=A0ABN9YG63_9DINO|nr:unnamed protein product [Polarella glacialis]
MVAARSRSGSALGLVLMVLLCPIKAMEVLEVAMTTTADVEADGTVEVSMLTVTLGGRAALTRAAVVISIAMAAGLISPRYFVSMLSSGATTIQVLFLQCRSSPSMLMR